MKATIREVTYGYHFQKAKKSTSTPWLMLHGFTGTKGTFEEISHYLPNESILTVDLIGHGESFQKEVPESRYQIQEQCLDLKLLLEELTITKVKLLGYSMGGRVALAFAVMYPELVESLVLESSSPGLKTQEERTSRQISDNQLAETILKNGVTSFVAKWEKVPLFASQDGLPKAKKQAIRQERLMQDAFGLAYSLRQMGTGSQPNYWGELIKLNMPVYLMVGELDNKFKNISREMMELIPVSEMHEFLETGHAIHLEKPLEFAKYLKEIS